MNVYNNYTVPLNNSACTLLLHAWCMQALAEDYHMAHTHRLISFSPT